MGIGFSFLIAMTSPMLGACGGGNPEGQTSNSSGRVSCSYSAPVVSPAQVSCQEYAFADPAKLAMYVALYEDGCKRDDGKFGLKTVWATTECDKAGTLGGCVHPLADEGTLTEWFFGAAYEAELASVKSSCTGPWVER
jgi:hypothetical protein